MLNVDDRRPGSACFRDQCANSGQHTALDFGGYQFYQTNLDINDEQCVTRSRCDSLHAAILCLHDGFAPTGFAQHCHWNNS